jgi:hypothetical protein
VESQDPSGEHDYLAREAKARVQIDRQLAAAGWMVQSQQALSFGAATHRHNGRDLEQWEYEVTSGGRVPYVIDDQDHTAWLVYASPRHPKIQIADRQAAPMTEDRWRTPEPWGADPQVSLRQVEALDHRQGQAVHPLGLRIP